MRLGTWFRGGPYCLGYDYFERQTDFDIRDGHYELTVCITRRPVNYQPPGSVRLTRWFTQAEKPTGSRRRDWFTFDTTVAQLLHEGTPPTVFLDAVLELSELPDWLREVLESIPYSQLTALPEDA